MIIKNGQTDVTTYFVLRDATTHAPKADVTVGDIDIYYVEQGAAISAKADVVALDAADSAHADNKGFHVGQALYRIDWPDAAFDGGIGKMVTLIVVCTGVDTTFLEVQLSPAVNASAVSDDATAADILELFVEALKSDTGQIDDGTFAANAITNAAVADDVDVNVKTITNNAITANAINADAITAAKIADAAIDFATFAADCKTGSGLKANVESITANAITATAINADAITAAKIADAAIDFATFAADCKTGSGLKANVESITANAITATAINADAITAAKIADGAIDNATFAADVGSTAYATNILALAVRKVLDELNLDHLMKVAVANRADMTAEVVDDTVLANIMAKDAGDTSDYNPATDSLEAQTDAIVVVDGVADLIEDIVRNQLEITNADGAVVLRADNNTDALYTVAAGITDDSTKTIRKRLA